MDLWKYESKCRDEGFAAVCGVDEAGRGPLAGPVFAAAVILPFGLDIPGLDDSKKLTEKKRDKLYDIIISSAVSYGIASASHEEIDELNILNATYLAMNRAIAQLTTEPDIALIDGNRTEGIEYNCRCIIGGDGLSASIAAASILAKVKRDRMMREYEDIYPGYDFASNKGYGTAAHYAGIRAQGLTPIHRKTFVKDYL